MDETVTFAEFTRKLGPFERTAFMLWLRERASMLFAIYEWEDLLSQFRKADGADGWTRFSFPR